MGATDAASPIAPPSVDEFAALLDRCQAPLHAFLRRLVGDDEAARDLVQETFIAAWQVAQRAAPPFDGAARGDDEARRWLFHVAYNRAVSVHRRRAPGARSPSRRRSPAPRRPIAAARPSPRR